MTRRGESCSIGVVVREEEPSCDTTPTTTTSPAFTHSSKRRKGYPSETNVKRGDRIVHGDKELIEKLGRNDPCICGFGRRFQEMLHAQRPLRRRRARLLLSANEREAADGLARLALGVIAQVADPHEWHNGREAARLVRPASEGVGVKMWLRSGNGRHFFVAVASLVFWSIPALGVSPASADNDDAREQHCPSAQLPVASFHAELNAGSSKDMKRLARKAEVAAGVLISCADSDAAAAVIDRDRLRVRAADALFIAAVARYRTLQHRQEVTDLKRVLRLISNLNTAALTSNEHTYQEARLLRRFSERILGNAAKS
ncbi:MAG TPA: hypothetical protein VGT98_17615, partial [Candidatus Elarobacter sp.]|nr:hypothetical protein [Candidatus Elarobacter sp.]HEV2739610.1 hypothetical protein [Candidatus Elarobacter sp.]